MADDSRTGEKIRTIRESLGLSCEELAERSGCDVVVIRRLEDGELAASLAPLIKLTRALGVRLGTLLDDDTQVGPVVTRAGGESVVTRFSPAGAQSAPGTLEFYSLAAGKSARHMEPFLIGIDPADAGETRLSTHEGEEFIYVLEGAVEIAYGHDTHVLDAGDSIYYDSIVPHQVRAFGGEAARILAVVYAPL